MKCTICLTNKSTMILDNSSICTYCYLFMHNKNVHSKEFRKKYLFWADEYFYWDHIDEKAEELLINGMPKRKRGNGEEYTDVPRDYKYDFYGFTPSNTRLFIEKRPKRWEEHKKEVDEYLKKLCENR